MSEPKKLSRDEVLHLAKLAKLSLTEDEITLYQSQLSNIIGYFKKLNSIDTDDIEPIEQLTQLTNVTSDDVVSEERHLSQKQALQNAKEHTNGHIRVNAIFNNE